MFRYLQGFGFFLVEVDDGVLDLGLVVFDDALLAHQVVVLTLGLRQHRHGTHVHVPAQFLHRFLQSIHNRKQNVMNPPLCNP